MTHSNTCSLTLLALASLPLLTQADSIQTLPTLYIDAQQTANIQPVTTYESPISNLEFEPRVDLQSRGMAEAQGDVTIRGGIFEGTGFRVGSTTLIDPQTGHYFAELPIAPEMLTRPEILTGTDNALYGFNSTAGSISYDWSQIQDGGSATVGSGDHGLNFQRIHHGLTGALDESGDWSWGVEAEVSRSESDGTLRYGDHDFDRTTGRVQILGPNSQTDFFAGYQAKFFGWPGMYTANPARLETENLKTRLLMLNHQYQYGENSHLEVSAYARRHTDHYVLTRSNPTLFEAFHETDVFSLALAGRHAISDGFAVNFSSQFTTDSIDSKDFFNGTPLGGLERGEFQSRDYIKLSLLPEYRFKLNENDTLAIRAGAAFDDTNRDESDVSAILDISWLHTYNNGNTDRVYLSYAESSQVAGYTAIGGGTTSGLFRSNRNLERENSKNLEFGGVFQRKDWSLEAVAFYRWDNDLVDWTFMNDPFARSANPVDIENFGLELIGTKRWDNIETIASYTFLDKDEDYGNDAIVASFYALNYAKHRVTLGAIWRPCDIVEVRIDNEWRDNEDNALRNGSNSALFTHIGLSLFPPQVEGLELFFAIDNAWEDDFEDVPGTPGRGDQYSAGATFRW